MSLDEVGTCPPSCPETPPATPAPAPALPSVSIPWMWDISSRLLQQSTATAPYLGQGYLFTDAPPDLEPGFTPLGPPVPSEPGTLGRGPQRWGSSSRLQPLTSAVG